MRCPTCAEEVPLSWSRYLGNPRGSHVCPACAGRFRPRTTWRFYLAVGCAWSAALALALWAMRDLGLPLWAACALLAGLGGGLLLALDRWLDDRVRRAVVLPPRG
ncbi:MAG TPA: hypothetical protein VIX81_03120 [Gammaproteobacteria bacterium]